MGLPATLRTFATPDGVRLLCVATFALAVLGAWWLASPGADALIVFHIGPTWSGYPSDVLAALVPWGGAVVAVGIFLILRSQRHDVAAGLLVALGVLAPAISALFLFVVEHVGDTVTFTWNGVLLAAAATAILALARFGGGVLVPSAHERAAATTHADTGATPAPAASAVRLEWRASDGGPLAFQTGDEAVVEVSEASNLANGPGASLEVLGAASGRVAFEQGVATIRFRMPERDARIDYAFVVEGRARETGTLVIPQADYRTAIAREFELAVKAASNRASVGRSATPRDMAARLEGIVDPETLAAFEREIPIVERANWGDKNVTREDARIFAAVRARLEVALAAAASARAPPGSEGKTRDDIVQRPAVAQSSWSSTARTPPTPASPRSPSPPPGPESRSPARETELPAGRATVPFAMASAVPSGWSTNELLAAAVACAFEAGILAGPGLSAGFVAAAVLLMGGANIVPRARPAWVMSGIGAMALLPLAQNGAPSLVLGVIAIGLTVAWIAITVRAERGRGAAVSAGTPRA
ncbi:MAG: hypothetical protein ACYDDF_10845 [Thermoplasmatota archaeon]